jgi:cytochrome c biogenesis protein CcmG/thiol:disulfide interchange protein DsbE
MRRPLAAALVFLPALALLGLLGWGLVNAQGKSFAGFAVNARSGDAPVTNPEPADFSLKLLDGRTVRLSQFAGRPVLVDFWASWCPPCREEAPMLARVEREYAAHGVVFLGIALWDAEGDAERFVDETGAAYATGVDAKGAIGIDFGVTGIPEKYFIDRQGRVVRKFLGPVPEDKLREALDGLLAGR